MIRRRRAPAGAGEPGAGWKPAATLVLLALLPACDHLEACADQTKAPIVYVDIRDETAKDPEIPRPALEAAAREVMDAWPDFAFRQAEPGERKWQLSIEVKMASERTPDDPKPGLVHRAVGVRMGLEVLEAQKGPAEDISTDVVLAEDVPRDTPFADFAKDAVKEAGRRVRRARALYEADPEEVVAALSSDDERDRARAAVVAGDRELTEAVPRLMEIVRDRDEAEEIVLKSIGALVAIGDPRATSALIDAGRRKSSAYVAQIVYALSQLGGREAEGYLFTVKSGHPDPALREAAAEALRELERQRSAAADAGAP